mgnify:CR=1 FL=1
MSRLQHLHKNVRKFLKKEGYILPQRHDVIERKMRSLMEPSRYEKYLDIGDDMRAGLVGVSKLYQTVLTLEEAHLLFSHQSGLISETMVSIIDYELTLSKPRRLTIDSAIDTLTHGIEAYVSKKANRNRILRAKAKGSQITYYVM